MAFVHPSVYFWVPKNKTEGSEPRCYPSFGQTGTPVFPSIATNGNQPSREGRDRVDVGWNDCSGLSLSFERRHFIISPMASVMSSQHRSPDKSPNTPTDPRIGSESERKMQPRARVTVNLDTVATIALVAHGTPSSSRVFLLDSDFGSKTPSPLTKARWDLSNP
jgi:hypothetical protein